jgi:formate dehydrogenase major subunit
MTPKWAGISHERLGSQGLHWPVWDKQHPGTARLYEGGKFTHANGKAKLALTDYIEPGETTSPEFPFILVTGRQLAHYNCGTMTRRTANIELHPEDCLEMAAEDCERMGIKDGDYVEITNQRGQVRTHVWITERVMPGYVFMSFHFPEVRTNLLTSGVSDEFTNCPEYKVTAVSVEKIEKMPVPAAKQAEGIRPELKFTRRTPQRPFPVGKPA